MPSRKPASIGARFQKRRRQHGNASIAPPRIIASAENVLSISPASAAISTLICIGVTLGARAYMTPRPERGDQLAPPAMPISSPITATKYNSTPAEPTKRYLSHHRRSNIFKSNNHLAKSAVSIESRREQSTAIAHIASLCPHKINH